MVGRRDVTFTSGGEVCAGWWFAAETDAATAPCVVLGHGFSMTMGDGLTPYAEAFAAAGLHALAFDFRYLGDSGGEPRQRFRAREQQEDWRNALACARTLPGVDPTRIVGWGFSFGAGHLAHLLTRGLDLAAAVLLCPFVDGLARVLSTPPATAAWIAPKAAADLLGRHSTIPVTGPPGSRAAMAKPGEADGFGRSAAPGSRWRNEISPGVLLTVPFFRPVARAARIGVPLRVGLGVDDVTTHNPAVRRFARRAPAAELHELPGDDFAPFIGTGPATTAALQVDFLHRILP